MIKDNLHLIQSTIYLLIISTCFIPYCSVSQNYRKHEFAKYPLPTPTSTFFLEIKDSIDGSYSFSDLEDFLYKKYDTLLMYFSVDTNRRYIEAGVGEIINISKSDIPFQLNYVIKIHLFQNKIKYCVSNIYFKSIPSEKYKGKEWTTNAEEAIVDEALYTTKGKMRKIQAEYKVKTLTNIFGLKDELRKLIQ